ncbi:hypothetical protein EDC04DRAFT_3100592 [Pisolithus marmoratus]|nr:hypothetical protein EDC04DRAFT_3100592 [Pisolithus marmoratus]
MTSVAKQDGINPTSLKNDHFPKVEDAVVGLFILHWIVLSKLRDAALDLFRSASDSVKSVKFRLPEAKLPIVDTPQFFKNIFASGSTGKDGVDNGDHARGSSGEEVRNRKRRWCNSFARVLSTSSGPVRSSRDTEDGEGGRNEDNTERYVEDMSRRNQAPYASSDNNIHVNSALFAYGYLHQLSLPRNGIAMEKAFVMEEAVTLLVRTMGSANRRASGALQTQGRAGYHYGHAQLPDDRVMGSRPQRCSGLAASMAGWSLTVLTFIVTADFVDHLRAGYWFLLIAFVAEGFLVSLSFTVLFELPRAYKQFLLMLGQSYVYLIWVFYRSASLLDRWCPGVTHLTEMTLSISSWPLLHNSLFYLFFIIPFLPEPRTIASARIVRY